MPIYRISRIGIKKNGVHFQSGLHFYVLSMQGNLPNCPTITEQVQE